MPKTKKPKKGNKSKQDRAELLQTLTIFEEDFYDEDDAQHQEKIGRDRRGRPTVMTKQVIAKLRTAFTVGCTDKEACIYAGISEDVLYDFCKKHPEFADEKQDLKESQVIQARATIANAIGNQHSVSDSWEYLRRKRKEEFAEMKKVEVANAVTAKDLEDLSNGDVELIEEDDESGVEGD